MQIGGYILSGVQCLYMSVVWQNASMFCAAWNWHMRL